MKASSDQLYKLAGLARLGEDRQLAFKEPEEDGTINAAIRPREPDGSEAANGWRYYSVTREGVPTLTNRS